MNDRLIIEFRTSNSSVILKPAGEIDLTTLGRLREAIAFGIRRWSPTTVVIDLAAVTFLDSHGVRVLLSEQNKARESGCAFNIEHPRTVVARTLEIMGVLATLQS